MKEDFLYYYNLYKNDILRFAFSYTKKVSDAEDITQSVFIKLYKNIDNFKDANHIKRWCYKVAINECKNLSLSFWKKRVINIEDDNEYYEKIEKGAEELNEAIDKLSKTERIIIYLYYYEGYKVKEIAEILKKNSSTIQTKLTRARNKLRIILKGDETYEE